MKRHSAWQAALVLLAVGCLPGCKGIWNDLFGSDNSSQQAATLTPGSLEECNPERDPNLATWLTTNHPCSSTEQCHTGSFCTGNGTAGVCMRECGDGLPVCSGNRYCSCQGVCEEITPGVGNDAGSPESQSCERNLVRLMAIKKSDPATRARCESDEFCPNGAYCDQSTGYCTWDCFDELNCQGDTCCPSGLTCDCSGRCENPDAGATVIRRKFDVEVSPSIVSVVPGTGNADWVRSFDVILRTRDEGMLAGAGTTRSVQTPVSVRPGASLEVACNPTGSAIYFPEGCILGNTEADAWEFSLTGESWWVARKTVSLPPTGRSSTDAGASDTSPDGGPLTVGDDWVVRVYGEIISPTTSILTVDVQQAKEQGSWVLPVFDFGNGTGRLKGYKGNALIKTPLGLAVRAIPGVDHDINVPIRASIYQNDDGNTVLTIADPAAWFGQATSLTVMAQEPFMGSAKWIGLEKGTYQRSTGYASITYLLSDLRQNTRSGSLSARLTGHALASNASQGEYYRQIEASLSLEEDPSFEPCANDSACKAGTVCGGGGLCLYPEVNVAGAEVDTLLQHELRRGGDAAYAAMGLVNPEVYLRNLYQVTGIGNGPDPNGGFPVLGGKSLFAHGSAAEEHAFPPFLAASQIERNAAAGAYDIYNIWKFSDFLTGLQSTTNSYQFQLYQAGVPCDFGSECLYDELEAIGRTNLIACVDDNDADTGTVGTYDMGYLADGSWAVSCQRLWSNVQSVAEEWKDQSFESACHRPLDTKLWLQRGGQNAEMHRIYFCPGWIQPLLWGANTTSSRTVEAAYRYMCFDSLDATKQLTEHNYLVGQSLHRSTPLGMAGDHSCAHNSDNLKRSVDDTIPSGVDLIYALDRSPEEGGKARTKAEWLQSCMSDLSVPGGTMGPSPAQAQTALDLHLRYVFGKRDCLSAGHFFTALAQARESVEPDKAAYRDLPGQRLYLRLLQQWMQMMSFVGTQGLEEHRLAMQEKAAASLPQDDPNALAARSARPLKDLMMAMEGGFALIADQMNVTGSKSLGVDPWAVRAPDYRALPDSYLNDPDYEQQYGLPPQLLETATAYLRLVNEYLNESLLESYAQVVEGSVPDALVAARQRVGYGIRLTATVEAAAAALVDLVRPPETFCTKASEAADCPGSACSTQDGSPGQCVTFGWHARWDTARQAYHRVRRNLVEKTIAAENPLGISENDLPLFFGDLAGTNSRFFAASDYLISNWAVNAVSSAQGALDKARDAWISRRNAGLQDVMNEQEKNRRLEAMKQKYGQVIVDNCGLASETTAEKALEFAAKTYGNAGMYSDTLFADSTRECFIDRQRKGADGKLLCGETESNPVEDPKQEQIDACVNGKIANGWTEFLESSGYYKVYSRECTPQCKGFFRHTDNQGKTGDHTIRIRRSAAPPAGFKRWGYAQWSKGRTSWKEPISDEEARRREYDLYACEYNSHGLMMPVYCKASSGGQLEWCRPSDERDPVTGNPAYNVDGACRCTGGHLACASDIACGPRDVIFTPGDFWWQDCFGPGDGHVMAEQEDGTWLYRPCQGQDCAGPETLDPCGLPALEYNNWVYWESRPDSRCWGDRYETPQEPCNREICDKAASKWAESQTVSEEMKELYREECQHEAQTSLQRVSVLRNPPECYRGQMGAALLRIYSALQDVELAQLAWTAAQNTYAIQGRLCAQLEDGLTSLLERQKHFDAQMAGWRSAKARADKMVVKVRSAASFLSGVAGLIADPKTGVAGLVDGMGSVASAPFSIQSIELDRKMGDAQAGFDSFMRRMSAEQQVITCYGEANKLKAQFDVQKGQIVRRATDLAIAKGDFVRLLKQTQSALNEGRGDVTRESGRSTPTFAHSYWYDEKAERYLREFSWAQRLVYLAMRAVEYEFQQSLGIRRDILTAKHPDQLEVAIRALQTEVATRAINRRRPETAATVLSLRDEILGIVDMSVTPRSGERNFTPLQTFRSRLWDPKYAIYDKKGRWAGQGIPFVLNPQGALVDRCAERLWQVTATIQGDGLSEKEPGAPIKVLKRNTFTSQWCEGRGDGSSAQVGHLEPSRNLFRDDPGTGIPSEYEAYSTAAVYPWFNVRRADFYKTQYLEGASQELAGRGLYGDYVLLFPAELLEGKALPNPPEGVLGATYRINQFPLDRVEDVLLRFDHISVDNFSARGVQVKP